MPRPRLQPSFHTSTSYTRPHLGPHLGSWSRRPVPKKMARLFLVSDILHNSSASVRNASSYRSGFQTSLPDIFYSMHTCYVNINSRMGLETMKEQLMKVLQIWQAWSLFPLSFVMKLERILLYGTPDAEVARELAAKEAAKEGKAAAKEQPAAASPSEEQPTEAGEEEEDIDGEPMSKEPVPAAPAPAAAALAADEEKVSAWMRDAAIPFSPHPHLHPNCPFHSHTLPSASVPNA